MTRTSLVVVEDHQDCLDAFAILLGQKYVVFAYTSPVEALQAIDAAKPDVVVLDIGMQPLDGVQCLEKIRSMPGCQHIPAVALTGFAREVDRRRFLDHGFEAVVTKPISDLDEFMALIDRLATAAGSDRRRTGVLPPPAATVDQIPAIAASRNGGSGETKGAGRS